MLFVNGKSFSSFKVGCGEGGKKYFLITDFTETVLGKSDLGWD